MSRISNEEIINIRNKVNIVDIIADYIPLVQRGKNYFAVCPFHDDHNPSMSISPSKQIYTCFVCGASGNVFNFLMDYEHISFLEAVKFVADKVGIVVNINNEKRKVINNQDEKLYNAYYLINKLYQNNLNTALGKEAKKYLEKRGFSEEVIKEFGLGLALYDNKVYKLLKEKGYNDKELLESGLCNDNGKAIHDTFINRIMFPLWNIDGRVIAFSGRIYKDDNSSKYINSKESRIFKKGSLLYNYHRAKNDIRRQHQVIIVEGFMDVIALYKVGIKNVIATMGTAITSDQAGLIKRLSSNVLLCFDGDSAGDKATLNCSEELVKIDLTPKIIRLEDNLDPDDYIKQKGVEKLKYHIDNPMSLLNYKINMYKKNKNLNDSQEVSTYINEVIKELSMVEDNVIKEITLKKISDETGVSFETLNNILVKEQNGQIKKTFSPPKEHNEKVKVKNKYQKAEEQMLHYMMRHKEVIKMFENNSCFLPTQLCRYLANEIIYFYNQYHDINIADFIAFLGDKKELIELVGRILMLDLPEKYSQDEIHDYIEVLNDGAVEMEISRLKKLFKIEGDLEKKAIIAKQITDLRKKEYENEK